MDSWLGTLFAVMAFGPVALMGALYLVALVLWLAGRPRFLALLVERTGIGRRSEDEETGEAESPKTSGEPDA